MGSLCAFLAGADGELARLTNVLEAEILALANQQHRLPGFEISWRRTNTSRARIAALAGHRCTKVLSQPQSQIRDSNCPQDHCKGNIIYLSRFEGAVLSAKGSRRLGPPSLWCWGSPKLHAAVANTQGVDWS